MSKEYIPNNTPIDQRTLRYPPEVGNDLILHLTATELSQKSFGAKVQLGVVKPSFNSKNSAQEYYAVKIYENIDKVLQVDIDKFFKASSSNLIQARGSFNDQNGDFYHVTELCQHGKNL